MHQVACDVCGKEYSIAPQRMGEWLRCKECRAEFEVASYNFVDGKKSGDDDDETSWWDSDGMLLTRRIVRGVVLLIILSWLTSLFFVDPPEPVKNVPWRNRRSEIISHPGDAFILAGDLTSKTK